jgi:squalene-hopene/tetraprenyl-beta-curcumene cyclase
MRLFLVAILCVLGTGGTVRAQSKDPGKNSPDEPMAGKFSLARSADFLDRASVSWTEKRKCGTCHTNYSYLMARPVLKEISTPAMVEVRKFFEGRVANWDSTEKAARPRWDAEVVATAVSLAINDAGSTGKLHPLTRQALDRMWTLQQKDGAWKWLKCGWPPMEHDDYFGAVWAAVGVGLAPDAYASTPKAKKGLAQLHRYLKTTPAPDLHHQAMLLWASQRIDGLMTKEQQRETIEKLLSLQRPDGGWNLPSLGTYQRHGKAKTTNDPNGPSDGYGTGFVIYVLRQAGVPADHEKIQRGVAWLKRNQRISGRWFTRSLSTDTYHFITHAGTAYAVLALRACGVKGD